MNDQVIKEYTNPENPGAFSGISGFIKNNKKYKNDALKLTRLTATTLHRPIRKRFQRSKTIVDGIDSQWQVDLVDLSNISGSNYKRNFILTCIDVLSKYAWAISIKDKSSKSTKEAFHTIFKDGRIPKSIYYDAGNEFKGECKRYLESKNIQLLTTTTKQKASVVERFNRTLKEKMFRYFTYKETTSNSTNLTLKRYIDVLTKLVKSYNNSYHRSIKTKPINVNKKNEQKIFFNLYGYDRETGDDNFISIKFKKGQNVRVRKQKSLFQKGYTQGWSKEIFIINKIHAQVPVLYSIVDVKGKEIKELFYTEELQPVEIV